MIRSNLRIHADAGSYRVLQLTDFHSDADDALARRTHDDVRAMVQHFDPDFLAVTGDIWCSDETPERAHDLMLRDFDLFDSFELPWAFTPGNHDYAEDWSRVEARLIESEYALTEPERGLGNEVIALYGEDNARPLWELFFVNSGERWELPDLLPVAVATKPGHVPFRDSGVPTVFFFHIPLKAYQDAIDSDAAVGIANEEVLCWGDEDGAGSRLFTLYNGARACFCGHSHRNDFFFVEDDVTFSYGRATGHGGYGDDVRKGAKLIELDTKSDRFWFRTVFADGTSWHPERV